MFRYQKTRYITIQTRWVESLFGFIRRKPVPEIRICGLWLSGQGFFSGKRVKVTVRQGMLLIQPIQENAYQHENDNINKTIKLTRVTRKGQKAAPQLRLSGKFLEEHGFNVDETVDILAREELLIIQPLKDDY